MKKHLSSVANHLLQSCAREMGTSVDRMVGEFKAGLKGEESDYNKKLVEFCASKALQSVMYERLEEKIGDGSLSRFTFDMILAWESPSPVDEELKSECVAKEREDLNPSVKTLAVEEQDDVPLFYSDLVPLMQVDDQQSIGEDAFVWLASLFPFVADVVNSRFTFEALTASTLNRLYYPAYDLFIKEIYKKVKYIQQQVSQTGVELRDDEVVLHVDGTGNTQRVIRHIGGASWPGRLILTNYALYFEASGVITYEKAIKIDLSKQDVDHNVSPAPTGPWGAPLFDKGMVYESSQLSESLVLEFPEVASSIRRDYWLTLVKEVILLHNFFSSYNNESVVEKWEMHCRTILGIYRLHAVREMLRVSPPAPSSFLIFSLYDELPKGDYVLQELASNLKQISSGHPFTATCVLESLNIKHPSIHDFKHRDGYEKTGVDYIDKTSLETTINQVKQEAEETYIAKSGTEKLKEEGLSNSVLILLELLSPYKSVLTSTSEVAKWERPAVTLLAMFLTFIIIYKEWIGHSISVTLLYGAVKMLWLRHKGVDHKCAKVVADALSDPTAMETIVTAQHGMLKLLEMVQRTNISIMKLNSLLTWTAPKHAKQVIMGLLGAAALFTLIPIKFIVMAITCYCFMMSFNLDKRAKSDRRNRRLREWWDSIPVCPVQIVCANP